MTEAASLKDYPEATAWCREGDKQWQPLYPTNVLFSEPSGGE
jgi:hypothetical protein